MCEQYSFTFNLDIDFNLTLNLLKKKKQQNAISLFLTVKSNQFVNFWENTLKNFAKEIAPYKNTLINSA